ncbi:MULTISPECIES: TetR/AcrR family transcriptional regulator [Cyanophyceae]|uniref:TetR/AcrR family transcriptional regulator n=1 Tax=Cyanophyceae TaxID=3028117 RepID=UPI001687691B|nr:MULTISPECIES: TetR/AcrR family transcriptional regulator [Cyanophyceae]MBD1914854.1 TetR/AcrR family transcriptional regulator [Phormidium sp. FACHB-77]MBD2031018.1 TetR/AcrR family transcriptional regulator [Phormidium sp. FACHB-322]MBD2052625.1 TetR/AcrR family transcriptional regulator [Leptolyngbya sp. FACHB-60]
MRQADTKTQILDVAQDLIQRLGVNGMSYQDISDRVGIRKASVHTHFPKKDDLVAALLDRYSDRFLRMVDGILESSDSAEVKLRRYCSLYSTTLSAGEQDKTCLCAMLGAELVSLSDPLVERVRYFYQVNVERLVVLLEAGRQAGDFRFSGDTKAMAALIFGLLEGGMLVARVYGGATQFHQSIEQLIRLANG